MNWLRFFVFVIWSLALAALLLLGRYSLFIRAQLWPLLLGTLLMFVLFLVAMGIRRRGAAASAAAWAGSSLLLLPLAYLFPLMSRASASGLNSFALQKRSLGLSNGLDSSFGSANSPLPVSSASADAKGETMSIGAIAQHFQRLIGQRVVTDGRVYRDDSVPGGQLQIYRFVVVCCAADAMPVQVVVKAPDTAGLKNDQWVRVAGTVGSMQQDGSPVPMINATRVTPIPAPQEPYLSPYRF